MSKKNAVQVRGSSSVEPLTMESREQTIKENLKSVQLELANRIKSSTEASNLVERWDKKIALAERKLKGRQNRNEISTNALQTAHQLLDDARDRRDSINNFYINQPTEEVARLMEAETALISLQSRLQIQRFREDFTGRIKAVPSSNSKEMAVLSDDTLVSIDRELRTWAHSIEALKELRSA